LHIGGKRGKLEPRRRVAGVSDNALHRADRHDNIAHDPVVSTQEQECTLNKAELIDAAADRAEIAKNSMSEALDAVLQTITETVARGDKVTLTGFGTFERRHREARTGRNPQTGAEMQIPAQHSPAFKAGKAFKDAVAK
jgi:DNA-binding protein HU-beta